MEEEKGISQGLDVAEAWIIQVVNAILSTVTLPIRLIQALLV